jgi:hypothetical protein
MAETLFTEDGKRCGDAIQDTLNVDVDHFFPILDAQFVKRRDRHNTGIVEENVKLAVTFTCEFD